MHEHLRLAGKLDEATSIWHPEEPFSPNKGVTSTEPSIPVLGEPLWAIGVVLELSSPLSLDLVDMGMANPYKTRKKSAKVGARKFASYSYTYNFLSQVGCSNEEHTLLAELDTYVRVQCEYMRVTLGSPLTQRAIVQRLLMVSSAAFLVLLV